MLFMNEPFLRKMLVSFFSSNVPLYIEKNPIELKTYTSVDPKFVFEKTKSKVLHYIQHDFIRQRLGFSKDQAGVFKCFVIN